MPRAERSWDRVSRAWRSHGRSLRLSGNLAPHTAGEHALKPAPVLYLLFTELGTFACAQPVTP